MYDNAVLATHATCFGNAELFDRVYQRLGRNLPRFVAFVRDEVAHQPDPEGYLRGRLGPELPANVARVFFRLPLWPEFEFSLESRETNTSSLRFSRPAGATASRFDPETAAWRFVVGDLPRICRQFREGDQWGFMREYLCYFEGCEDEYVLRFDLGLLQTVFPVRNGRIVGT